MVSWHTTKETKFSGRKCKSAGVVLAALSAMTGGEERERGSVTAAVFVGGTVVVVAVPVVGVGVGNGAGVVEVGVGLGVRRGAYGQQNCTWVYVLCECPS
ncbi:hypothetical protein GE21DRAFT_9802 [Neurospora crassa]|uniref:Uncharacterized protein n=1 Tax=Neurospora crassa (strain ATCC 24698 / 74-OR23-1A / CBS 708.71 / DSM 1257 / FGSC 987) TaxID=367110 RepID=Q7S3F5_NEUCR|nr:hypothetical protein NCU06898 [Neurospora crassa OR74A]EAA30009.3 hypothetical protein NCU06898 [Neurospora crassa OR74A]KHE82573.1 hypothetical protein GE21DRAFT_9802 [Neurospora crassa]|eukprot:XP_959245.3 hypothetical protein NCU06898 [Neurospora crassa OR74A]